VSGKMGLVTDFKARGTTVLVSSALLFNAVQRMSVDQCGFGLENLTGTNT